MNPILAMMGLAALWGFGRKSSHPRPPEQRILLLECEGWDIPDAWWRKVAQPYWEAQLERLERSWARRPDRVKIVPTEAIAKNLLIPELQKNPPTDLTWVCSMPPGIDYQTSDPQAPNHWEGPSAMLALLQHIHAIVQDASARYFENGDRVLYRR